MNPDTGEYLERELIDAHARENGRTDEEALEELIGTREALEVVGTAEQVEALSRRVHEAAGIERARRDIRRRELRARARAGK